MFIFVIAFFETFTSLFHDDHREPLVSYQHATFVTDILLYTYSFINLNVTSKHPWVVDSARNDSADNMLYFDVE